MEVALSCSVQWGPVPGALSRGRSLCRSGTAVVGWVLRPAGGTLTETGFSFFLLHPFPLVPVTAFRVGSPGHVLTPAPGLPG